MIKVKNVIYLLILPRRECKYCDKEFTHNTELNAKDLCPKCDDMFKEKPHLVSPYGIKKKLRVDEYKGNF